jgi:hypothetical protein
MIRRFGKIIAGIAIGLLSIGVLSLAWKLRSEIGVRDQLAGQIEELKARLADKSRQDDLQKQCVSQAEKMFLQSGFKLGLKTQSIGGTEYTSNTEYKSHYSFGLNRCFLSVDDLKIYPYKFHYRFLIDAVENREYAKYVSPAGKDLSPMVCRLSPSPSMETRCESEADYEAFVAHYMQDGER